MKKRQTHIAAVGVNNAGKSTVLSSIIGAPVCEPKVTESTAIVTHVIFDAEKAAHGIYGVMDRDGEMRFSPIHTLADYTPTDNDDRLFLYHSGTTQADLNDAVFIDVPGNASIAKADHNRRAAEFVAAPKNYDILLDIVTPASGFSLTSRHTPTPTPTPRIIVINKVDELIDWAFDDPLDVIERTIAKYRDEAVSNVEDGIVACVIGYSAVLGLASEALDSDLLNSVGKITKRHGERLLSTNRFFAVDEAKAIVDEANQQLTQPFWTQTLPAYPAIRVAIGLALHECTTDGDMLRQRMRQLSGLDTLRQRILSLLPLTEPRREMLTVSSRFTQDARRLDRELSKIRALITGTDRLSETRNAHLTPLQEMPDITRLRSYLDKDVGVYEKLSHLASTQEMADIKHLRSYLDAQACTYAKLSHATHQALNDTQQAYIKAVNAVREGENT